MCGIVGYVGPRRVVPLVMDGLRRLEYRGYDSAGIAVAGNGPGLQVRRTEGKLRNLEKLIRRKPLDGTYGIGHTRWATHGRPNEQNAHPHCDCSGSIVVVHNGIIENYVTLKRELRAQGHIFTTDTDTEVIAHLVESYLFGKAAENSSSSLTECGMAMSLEEAVRSTIDKLAGIFAMAVIAAGEPNTIVAARNGPPVVIGLGTNEYFVASDIPAILNHTRDLLFLSDGDLAIIKPEGVRLKDFHGQAIERDVQHINWAPIMAERGGYRHFMLKEIYEQPRAVRDTALGRISVNSGEVFLEQMDFSEEELQSISRLNVAACGTSWHAGLAGKYLIERLARVPVDVDYASEFRYRDSILIPNSVTVLISQSGETADTIAAQREAKLKGCRTVAICNVVGSMVTREADSTVYTHAGPEIGVASTKAFTAQLTALILFALYLATSRRQITREQARIYLSELNRIPCKLEAVLAREQESEVLSRAYSRARNFLFLGRGIHYPVALEGALKLKEISYIHAEGYPAGEMKHGPNALIDESLPVVVIATRDLEDPNSVLRYEKTISNIQEVKARSGKIIAIASDGDDRIVELADHVLFVPPAPELLSPILEIVPLQLLAYHIALRRGCDVDQPRNLAKSVTVE